MPVPRKVKPWRGFPSVNAVHGIRARIQQSNPNPAQGEFSLGAVGTLIPIGTVPPGAKLLPLHRTVETALAGTTATADVVKADGTIVYAAITAAAAAGHTEIQPATGAGGNMPTVETPLYLRTGVAVGGATGAIDLLIRFYVNKD